MARNRKRWIVRFAALAALMAWIFKRKKADPAPEGLWQDVTPEP